MQFGDERAAELFPVGGAVAGLDVDGADVVAVGGGDDRRHVAALGLVDVPDPHPLADERRVPPDPGVFEHAGAAGVGRGAGGGEREGKRQDQGKCEYVWMFTKSTTVPTQ